MDLLLQIHDLHSVDVTHVTAIVTNKFLREQWQKHHKGGK